MLVVKSRVFPFFYKQTQSGSAVPMVTERIFVYFIKFKNKSLKLCYSINRLNTKSGKFNRHDDGLGRGRQRLLGGRCHYRGSPLLIVVDAD